MSGTTCVRFHEDIVGLLEGTAAEDLRDHVASCDFCRDARHDLESVVRRVAKAGDDFAYTGALAERLAAIVEEATREAESQERVSETRMRESATSVQPAPETPAKQAPVVAPAKPAKSRKAMWLLLAACASVGLSAFVGFQLADRQRSPELAATRAWHGKIAKISRSGADKSGGLAVATPSGKTELGEGAEIKAGMQLSTDGRTRARIELDDGSFVVLDRGTDVTVESAPRTLTVTEGAILADVAHVESAPGARIKTPAGWVNVLGTKLAVTSATDRMNVEVLRGEVEIGAPGAGGAPQRVSAGQEGVVAKDGRIDVAPANDLAQRVAFGEQLIATHNEDAEAAVSGLGELRARRPGKTDEKDHAVRLAKHAVKVRIAGNVARTEIDEEFTNDTNDELEGIYRFPLPHGAQIERLALEVDGKLVDGEFLDKAKAAAIWRGAIRNAAPQQPKPREEIVWVPGPWHDPAILEWARGGRFELKIFPIPKKGSRRVIIAYTETIAPASGMRRYVYPLPQGASSKLTIDTFSVDARVLGHDAKAGVHARGYELEKKTEGNAEQLRATMTAFTPSGDLAIEYGLDDRTTDAKAWAYSAPAAVAPVAPEAKDAKKDPKKEADTIGNAPFVAIALRPKLPRWTDTKPRDQVVVVDAGRSMFGERFARAKRLAVQMTQEMDRRDRLTVLACDVTCKAMPGGFVAPGAPAAHDVDAFLAGVTPDGASDLVGAVRAAASASGHDKGRDLRVVMISDGVATAGYRSSGRIAAEVGELMGEARAEVVTVPIGADADVTLLGEISRGGGGVVVPYQPGQRLEATALEVLNATYGSTLRDVELVLPQGARDVAPASLPPLRAGSETIVTARLDGDALKGDIVLRGKVGGDPFEAKYPIDVRATQDVGNAFVPRLFAAARIADRERDATDAQKSELIALSRRFSVPSRFTSLLVLESEAMFKAFGIERADHAAHWTGETTAQGYTVATTAETKSGAGKGGLDREEAQALLSSSLADGADDVVSEKKKDSSARGDLGLSGIGEGGGGLGRLGGASGHAANRGPAPEPRSAPAATMAPGQQAAPPPPAKAAIPRTPPADSLNPFAGNDEDVRRRAQRRFGGGQFMKKIFVRRASIHTDPTPAVSADKVAAARLAVQSAPDERGKHKELAKLLALGGQLDELGETLEKWSLRDPLDADVIVGRADLAARRGDREAALRILGGALAASAMSRDDAFVLATTVGRSYERLGRPEACAFQVTAAELKPTDVDTVARAVACEKRQGRARSAERWLSGMKEAQRGAVSSALAKIDPNKPENATGDVVVNATWEGGADLDIALLDPAGRRAGVATRMKGARIEGAQARDHETLALATGEAGSFVVEIVRASTGEGSRDLPASGKVTIRAFGQTQTVPFTLTGARTQVARVDVRWEAELVPVADDFGVVTPQPERVFDRSAAAGSLARVSVAHCGASGQLGTGHVTVTFAPSGRVSEVIVDDPVFAGTAAGRCVTAAFFGASVAPFTGSPVRVGKSFTVSAPIAR
ncbi:MAG: FecR domain-containing protein [Labilithrix sp.]|nr:FecR domain-containing protein [Labilithrix sp.]